MTDIVSAEKRSEMMSGIRSKNTRPELIVRSILHSLGFRFRLHRRDLPGKPDIVLPKWKKVVFVNGCYWHGHANCHLFRPPKTRTEFWTNKIDGNRERDRSNHADLIDAGWSIVVIWECAVSKKTRLPDDQLAGTLTRAILSSETLIDIRGQ